MGIVWKIMGRFCLLFLDVVDGCGDAWVVWAWIHCGIGWLHRKQCVYVCIGVLRVYICLFC